MILSLLNFMLSNGLSTWGVKYISSGLGAIIGAIFPLWIVLISLFRGEKLSKWAVVGMLISFGGVCLVFYDYLADFLKPDFQFGIFLSVLATLTWAFGSLYTKKKAASFNPYFSLGLQMLLSSILLFAYTGATGTSIPLTEIPAASWWSIAYLVVIGSVFYVYCFYLCFTTFTGGDEQCVCVYQSDCGGGAGCDNFWRTVDNDDWDWRSGDAFRFVPGKPFDAEEIKKSRVSPGF